MDTTYAAENTESSATGQTAATGPHVPSGSPRPLRTDTILSGTASLVVFTGMQRAIGFGRSMFLCRMLRADLLGQWDMAFGFLSFAMPLTLMGVAGSLGRFVDYFRQRGRLFHFLYVTLCATVGLGITAAAAIVVFRAAFSRLIFGQAGHEALVVLVALALLAMISFSYTTKFFVAMRLQRISSLLSFLYGTLFAVSCVLLLLKWASATTVVVAHLLSLLSCCCLGVYFGRQAWQSVPAHEARGGADPIWPQLLPFSLSLWTLNVLWGVLALVDRYMIVHFSGTDAVLELVGQYYVARIVPLLMTAVATMFGALLLPYLSRQWEAGDRAQLARRLDLMVRATGLAAFAAAVVCLFAVPFLFQWGFGNKFELGLAVLGLTLAYAVAHCMYCVARLYLLCDKSVWLINVVVVLTIAVNVGLNLVLLPRFGIYGVAAAGCTSAFTLLMGILCTVRLRGMPLNLVTPGIALLPLALLCGPAVAFVVLAVVLALAVLSPVLFAAEEKEKARQLAGRVWRGGRIESLWQRMGTR